MRTRIGIRARVIVLACLAALPLFLVALYNAKDREGEELEDAHRETLVLARTLAALQADVISHTRQLLYGLAAGYETRPEALFGLDCASTLRRIADASPAYANVTVADAQGNIRCSVEPMKSGISVADRNYFRRAIAENALTISDAVIGRVTGRAIVVVAQPVYDPFKPVSAVLLASVDVERLSELMERASPPADVVATLVDMDGRVMARRPHVPEYLGTVFHGFRNIKETSAGSNEGLGHLVGLDGVPQVAAYARLSDAHGGPRYVVAGIPRARVERQATGDLQRSLIALAITLLLAIGLGFVAAQRLIVNPLRQLTRAAERYSRGELSVRSGLSHEAGEVGMLATAFDALAASNQHMTRALRALSAGNRAVLRERSETALLAAMCDVAVEHAGYRLALINYAQHDEHKSVRTMAKAGHDEGFVDALHLTWADTQGGRGTVGPAIRTGRTTVVRSIPADPHYAMWREAAVSRGFGSVASFPLRVEGGVIGTFTLIAAEEDGFDGAEIELLEEMAADLSFGIEVIRGDAKRREAEAIARRSLTHDALVDLPNRPTFIGMVDDRVATARRTGATVAVLALHVGRLQEIFDSFGYEPYRVVVKEIAARLATIPACVNALGRLPMEDFGLVAPAANPNSVGVIADRLLKVFGQPIQIGEARIDVRASVGVSFFPEHGDDGESLVRRASIVGQEAFRKDDSLRIYKGPTERENPNRLSLAADLRAAIDGNLLQLHYQPKVRLSDGTRCGCEALVRWSHPSRGRIPPVEFLPVAEQMGLMGPMSYNILKMAVRQQREWLASGRKLPIAINLSARNLYDPMLVKLVARLLKSSNLPGDLLEFEITESALVDDPETARRVLTELRAMGSRIYIDDFGTGYSSLSYLVTLPVNSLKVDRSFIRQMAGSPQAHSVVSSIISMAHNLNMEVVAEGVETAADLEALKALGCDEAQGYLFGKPVPANEL